jgi:hypothetical protein
MANVRTADNTPETGDEDHRTSYTFCCDMDEQLQNNYNARGPECSGSLNLSFPWCGSPFFSIGRLRPLVPKPPNASSPPPRASCEALAFLIVIVLLSTTRIPLPWLYRQLWPSGIWPFWVGAAFTVVGLLFAWARQHLGGNWSRSVTIKQGHEWPLCPGPSPHLHRHSVRVSWHRDCALPGARGHRFRPNIPRVLGQAPHGGGVDAFPI